MDITEKVSKLLSKHKIIGDQLVEIPTRRVMTYREELQDKQLIGKPRFDPKNLEWDSKLLVKVRDHLQKIWNLFAEYSYWFDDRLKEILLHELRRLSKKSILFLLERDVWETDEVYGDYLIEDNEETTKISYFRFYHKFKTFSLPKKSYSERETWIKKNVVNQIQTQFLLLWMELETEIQTCQDEKFKRPIPIQLTDEDLIRQYECCHEMLGISREAALLMLGRLEEVWLLKTMGRTRIRQGHYLLSLAELKGVINKSNRRLFQQIRTNYNRLKHDTTYDINQCDVESLIRQFHLYLNHSDI